MKCVKAGGNLPFSCGQCMPCRIDKKREWTSRLVLEARSHSVSSFITLTYKDMPPDGSLDHRDIQLWLKRLRKEYGNVRYYAVGEYGDTTWRPHYHVALFGYPSCKYGRTRRDHFALNGTCCPSCDLVHKTWKLGMVEVAQLTRESAGYVCGYTTKKMTRPSDPRLGGRRPEYAKMSLNPGIGALETPNIANSVLTNQHALDKFWSEGSVPSTLNASGTSLQLGRYLRGKLHDQLGFDRDAAQKIRNEARHADLSAMWQDQENFTALKASDPRFVVFSQEEKLQKARNLESRVNLYSNKRKI